MEWAWAAEETALTNSAEMKVYVEATGDSDGIVPAGGGKS